MIAIRPSFRRRLPAALVLAAVGTGCARGDGPRWTSLTANFAPTTRVAPGEAWGADPRSGTALTLWPEDDETADVWIGATVERSSWAAMPIDGLWVAPRPLGNIAWNLGADDSLRLFDGAREFGAVPFDDDLEEFVASTPRGSFTPFRDELFLWLREGEQPPERAEFRARIDRGHREDAGWRVPFGRWTVDGMPIWTGMEGHATVDLAGGGALRFATGTLAISASSIEEEPDVGAVRFTVRLDGEVLFTHDQSIATDGAFEHHVVALPARARRGARIEFAASGDPALACVGTPRIGPLEIGDYVERPWGGDRPDVVLMLADTFRADNLTTYGGTRDLTPRLDALADDALVFLRARSPAMWTLPSHASMFTGLYPHEHTAVTATRSLPREAHTLAEHLAAEGYRTGAITDAGFVGRNFGLEQGFEWFDEGMRPLDEAHAAVLEFLDRDDGRPVLLFVHTYRTHEPYRVSDATAREHGERLGLDGSYDELVAAFRGGDEPWWNDGPLPESLRPLIPPYRALHDAGVIDLDRGFGDILDALAARGVGREAWTVFTSDHGEAFAEHGAFGHEDGIYEENIRIPLVIRGPGVEPRESLDGATLVDLAATIAEATGLAPAPAWGGRSLLSLDEDRPIFAFQSGSADERDTALMLGGRKLLAPSDSGGLEALIGLEPFDLRAAFDLDRDPGEQVDVRTLEDAPEWPTELLRAHRARWSAATEPRFSTRASTATFEDEEALRRLGYLEGE